MSETPELLPCPHCGSVDHPRVRPYPWELEGETDLAWGFHVICDASGFDNRRRGCGSTSGWGETRAEATDVWNRRTPLITSAPDMLEALRDIVAYLSETPHHNAVQSAAARAAIAKATGEPS